MRTTTVQGYSTNVYKVTYPDDNIFLWDHNTITCENLAESKYGVVITITNENTSEEQQLRYRSEIPTIVFDLDSTLQAMYADNAGLNSFVYTITFFDGDNITDDGAEVSFQSYLLLGKSFTSESHACERVIYAYQASELEYLEMYFEAAGTLTIDGDTENQIEIVKGFNTVDLSEHITSEGTHSIHYLNSGATPSVTITSVFPVDTETATVNFNVYDNSGTLPTNQKRGGVYVDSHFTPAQYTITLIYSTFCEDYDVIELDYINCDGCRRHIAGKLVSENTNTEYQDYTRANGVYRNTPFHYMTGNEQVIKVAFDDLDRSSYWNYALLSEQCWFNNYNWQKEPCYISTSKVTKKSDELQDVELEITLIKQ